MNSRQGGLKTWERLGLHFAGASLVVVMAALTYGLFLRPSAVARAEALNRIHSLKATIASRPATTAAYAAARDRQLTLQKHIHDVRSRLTAEPDLNRLLRELSILTEKHGAKVLSIQPTQRRDGDRAAYQRVQIRLSANYESLCHVLQSTTEMDCLVWINGAKITSNRKTNAIQPIELEIALVFAPEGTQANKITSDSIIAAGDA